MKIPRPEHSSWFLCPLSPCSSSPDHSSLHLDLLIWICSTWNSPCLHLVSLSVPERQLAELILCIYFSPSPPPTLPLCMPCITSLSWPELNASGLSISSSSAGFYHTPSPLPSSRTAAASAAAPPCFILLLLFITLWGFGLSCCTTSAVVLKKRYSSANVSRDPSQGLNIQINFPGMPHSGLFFMVSLLFCMNNRCLCGCWILQRFFPPSLTHRMVLPLGSCFTYLLRFLPSHLR